MSEENEVVEPQEEIVSEEVEASEESQEEQVEIEEGSEEGEGSPETEEELKEAVEEAIEEGASEEEIKQMVKEFHLKVNGREIVKKVDLNDEEGLQRILQREAAGQQAMQEIAEMKKLWANELSRLKNNPWEVLQELNLDPDELAERRLQERIEEMKKSPEQLEREKMQKELEEARQRLKEQEERAAQAEEQRLREEAAVNLDEEISKALDAHTTLAASPMVVKRIAQTMLWAMDNGYDDISASDVLPTVEAEIKEELNNFMSELPEDMIEAYIGQKASEKLRQKRLNIAKNTPKTVSNAKKEVAKSAPKEEKPRTKQSLDAFMRSR